VHPRFGYRRAHALLVADGWTVNRKRVGWLWGLHGMRVPPRRVKAFGAKAFGDSANSAWELPALRPSHVWSYDLVAVRTATGAPLRVLNVVDEFTREFIAATVLDYLNEKDVKAVFIAKASPQQNCYVERFNGSMRDELLHGEELQTLTEARVVIGAWTGGVQRGPRPRAPRRPPGRLDSHNPWTKPRGPVITNQPKQPSPITRRCVTQQPKARRHASGGVIHDIGGPRGDRTHNPRIKSPLLCQLS
jgi:putative transposase